MMILIPEDDIALLSGIELALAASGRQFKPCHNIAMAKAALKTTTPDRVIAGRFRLYVIGGLRERVWWSGKGDLNLLISKYRISNPFTELKINNFSFHCFPVHNK